MDSPQLWKGQWGRTAGAARSAALLGRGGDPTAGAQTLQKGVSCGDGSFSMLLLSLQGEQDEQLPFSQAEFRARRFAGCLTRSRSDI